MIKKISLAVLLTVLAGCSNVQSQRKNIENAVSALDKSHTGRVIVLYPDKEKIKTSGTIIEGKLQGRYIEFDENGYRKAVKNFKDGLYHGYYAEFYPNGTIKMRGNYINGYKNGTFSFYNENGKKIQEGNYVNGLRRGIWKNFDENGKIVSSVDYKNTGFINPEERI